VNSSRVSIDAEKTVCLPRVSLSAKDMYISASLENIRKKPLHYYRIFTIAQYFQQTESLSGGPIKEPKYISGI
jgi:hypothetical protein